MEPSSISLKETKSVKNEKQTPKLDNVSFKNDSSTKTCIPFTKYGHCRFDQNCKFLHQQRIFTESVIHKNKVSNTRTSKTKSPRKDPSLFHDVMDVGKGPGSSYASSSHQNASERLCRYFLAGRCSKENCNFKHSPKHQFSSSKSSANSTNVFPLSKNKKKSIPLCHYFKRGNCLKGDACKFYHSDKVSYPSLNVEHLVTEKNESISDASNLSEVSPVDNNSETIDSEGKNSNQSPIISSTVTIVECETPCQVLEDKPASKDSSSEVSPADIPCAKEKTANQPPSISPNVVTIAYKTPCQVLKIFDLPLSEKEKYLLRETEIRQMKKRYPSSTGDETNSVFSFEFTPSDPDWVHDVTVFHLQITFPVDYPVEVCKIEVLQSSDFILETILRHLNKCISDWLHERHKHLMEMKKVELLFRPFLRWFDKNLNDMFSFCFLKKKSSSEEANVLYDENTPENKTNNMAKLPSNTLESPISGSMKTPTGSSYKAQKNGFNVSLTGLELVEGVGALSCTKLDIMLLCRRCKTSVHVTTTPKKNKSMTCSKCSLVMECNFEPSIIHQFTNVLGTVYLVGCTGLDVNLVECTFLVDCLNCSKQVPIQGLHPGSKQKFWCVLCNQKFLLSVQSSKFISSSVAYTSIKSEPVKKIERNKDLQIKEGGPLPEFGSCKHYKKSNRWFRFPCCGRVFPCDICHEEKGDGHEIKFASRIICGFCSKEQPFTKDKPCSGCSAQVTAKSASHWEGGKGCRNKKLMSRGDKKKYSGISKTVPKNSQVLSNKKK